MRTVAQALADEVYYPLPDGFIANKLLVRGLNAEEEIISEILVSNEFKGAVADCLWSLVQAPNISESDKSISLPDRDVLLRLANSYYKEIGEAEKTYGEASVQFGF